MKFVCDSCRAQYMISDDKVGPAGVKVRCKRCSNVILVRREPDMELTQGPNFAIPPEEPSPQPPSPPPALDDEIGAALDSALAPRAATSDGVQAASPATEDPVPGTPVGPDPEQVEWYVAVDDQQVGPLKLADVRSRWEGSSIGPDTLAWRVGLPDWKALSQIPELALRLAPRATRAQAPRGGAPAVAPARGAWEKAAPTLTPASEPPVEDGGWKPSAGSALASLVEQEIEAARKPEPVPAKPGVVVPAVENTNVRNLLGALPEPPPAEPSRLIPISEKSNTGAPMPERSRTRTGFWGSPSRGGLGRVAVVSAAIAVGVLLLFGGGLYAFGFLQVPGKAPPQAPVAAAPAAPAPPPAAPAPDPAAAAPAPGAPAPADPAAVTAAPAPGAPAPAALAAPPAAPAAPAAPTPAPDAAAVAAAEAKADEARGARGRKGRRERETQVAAKTPPPSGGSVLDAGGTSSIDAAFEKELSAKGSSRKAPAPAPASDKPDKLGQGDIMGVVVAQKAAIKGCVGKYKESGGGSGTLVMRWTIQQSGRTSSVAPKGPDHAALASCIGKLIQGWRFPEYDGATMSPIEFPFTF